MMDRIRKPVAFLSQLSTVDFETRLRGFWFAVGLGPSASRRLIAQTEHVALRFLATQDPGAGRSKIVHPGPKSTI
jgi:hypothetical protein